MDGPLAVEPERARLQRRPPVALGVLVGGDRARRWRRSWPPAPRSAPARGRSARSPPGRARRGRSCRRPGPAARPRGRRPRRSAPRAARSPGRSRARWPAPPPPRSGPPGRWAGSGRASSRAGSSSTSTHHTSRARRTLGTISTSRASRAPVTTSMMSPWHHGVSMPLMRTARTVRPQSCPVSAPTAIDRAASLTDGAQASSRSRNTRSAPDDGRLLAHALAARRRGQLRTSGSWCAHDAPCSWAQMVPASRNAARRSASRPSRPP